MIPQISYHTFIRKLNKAYMHYKLEKAMKSPTMNENTRKHRKMYAIDSFENLKITK